MAIMGLLIVNCGNAKGGAVEFLDVEQAARIAKVHPETLREWLRTGVLQGRKFGRVWRTTREWLDEFGQRAAPSVPPSQPERERRAAAAAERIEAKHGIQRRKR